MPAEPAKFPTPDNFHAELAKFRQTWPMVYLEAWTPEDGEPGANWLDEKHRRTVDFLERNFDANQGTNWGVLHHAQQQVKAETRGL